MRSYRVHFSEVEKNLLKEMRPRIKRAKENFNRYSYPDPAYSKDYT